MVVIVHALDSAHEKLGILMKSIQSNYKAILKLFSRLPKPKTLTERRETNSRSEMIHVPNSFHELNRA